MSQAWWPTGVIPAQKVEAEDSHESEVNLGYMVSFMQPEYRVRLYFKNTKLQAERQPLRKQIIANAGGDAEERTLHVAAGMHTSLAIVGKQAGMEVPHHTAHHGTPGVCSADTTGSSSTRCCRSSLHPQH